MKKNYKISLILLNVFLFSGIMVGQYEWIEPKSVIHIFIIPAFVISASLLPLTKELKNKEHK